jgi:hypothetical protein
MTFLNRESGIYVVQQKEIFEREQPLCVNSEQGQQPIAFSI